MSVNPLDLHWTIKGNFLLNCNCDVFCNCPMSLGRAIPNSSNGKCFSWWGINIEEGYAEEKWAGFNPIKSIGIAKLNIGKIQSFIDNKKIKANEKINIDLLKKLKLINKKYSKIKILGNGNLKDKIDIEVDFVSKSVKDKLGKIGSAVKIKNSK